jgi:hypothetical protein
LDIIVSLRRELLPPILERRTVKVGLDIEQRVWTQPSRCDVSQLTWSRDYAGESAAAAAFRMHMNRGLETAMRYMIILNNDPKTEEAMPPPDIFRAMSDYNKSLFDAGILRALEGLSGSKDSARVTFAKGRPNVKDGPFAEAKELIGGFWIIEVKSAAEALEWTRRMPVIEGATVEVRRVAEIEDFNGVMPPETIAQEEAIRDGLARRKG